MYRNPDTTKTFYIFDKESKEKQLVQDWDSLLLLLSESYEIKDFFWTYGLANKYFYPKELEHSYFYIHYYKINYEIFDGVGRPINPKDFEYEIAKKFYDINSFYPDRLLTNFYVNNSKKRLDIYYGEFRREPVEGIHKEAMRVKTRKMRYKHRIAERYNPEMKPFRRPKNYSWDSNYNFENFERSWKRQSKRKHQWKDKRL